MSKIIWHSKHPVLDAGFEIISSLPKSSIAQASFHEAQAIILDRVEAACDNIRATIREPAERETAYLEVWAKCRKALWRQMWSQFSEVRRVFYSSEIDNCSADLLDYLAAPPQPVAKSFATAATYNPALYR